MDSDIKLALEGRIPIAKQLAAAIAAAKRGDKPSAEHLLALVEEERQKKGRHHGVAELKLLQTLRERFSLKKPEKPRTQASLRLPDGVKNSLPGVSVVTCCMNRTGNLLKALPTWLAHAAVDEVVVVDWSSAVDVATSLREAGIIDNRIRVVRAVDEPRWVLSFAFNLGFRVATREMILKVDADIILRSDFFEQNTIQGRTFIAGDWKVAENGQEHINGFFFARRSDLLSIKGFNEYITTYGWDDDDIYARLHESGVQRHCVDTKSIYHMPHDDAQRLGGAAAGGDNALAQLRGDTLHKIRSNRYIASVMPLWNRDRIFAPFEVLREEPGYVEVRREKNAMPHLVSDDIRADSEYYAAVELLSWRVGPTAYHIRRESFLRLLALKRLEEICHFDVDIANSGPMAVDKLRRHSLYVQINQVTTPALLGAVAQIVDNSLRGTDSAVFVRSGSASAAEDFAKYLKVPCHHLDFWVRESGLRKVSDLKEGVLREQVCSGPGALLTISDELLATLPRPDPANSRLSVVVPPRRSRLYIDCQHGLGNRLRALASAAAIARATDRELVVLWTPDHHCECKLTDLFEYDGLCLSSADGIPVETRRYNYMEIEQGAVKGEAIDLTGQVDVMVRSAYVLTHPSSQWDTENTELRRLKPTRKVMDLVQSVELPADCVGVHVRMEAGKGLDHHSYDSAQNWSSESHEKIHYWRAKSHYSAFMRRIDQLLSKHPSLAIFVATDLPETYETFRQYYGKRLRYLPRDHYDRSSAQLLTALADALLLSRCNRMLGSTWSSFSELAIRLSTTFQSVEMSGKDF